MCNGKNLVKERREHVGARESMYVRRWQIQPSDDSKLATGNPAVRPGTLTPDFPVLASCTAYTSKGREGIDSL